MVRPLLSWSFPVGGLMPDSGLSCVPRCFDSFPEVGAVAEGKDMRHIATTAAPGCASCM